MAAGCEKATPGLNKAKIWTDRGSLAMRRLQSLLLIAVICLTDCNGVVFFSAGFHPTNTLMTVSGLVSVIQITTIVSAGGPTTLVTVVTFLQFGRASTINFCGNVGNQFILNAFTTVDFIANLNLGSQLGTNALQVMSSGGEDQKRVAEALKQLTETIVSSSNVGDEQKKEIIQALSTVAAEAEREPEKRSIGTVRAIASWLPTMLASTADVITIWDRVGPVIKAHFGL